MEINRDISITTQHDGMVDTVFASSYSPEEQEDININRNNSELLTLPEFVCYYPEIAKQFELSYLETLIYGYLRFFLSRPDKVMFASNKTLAVLFSCSERTLAQAMSNLNKKNVIKPTYKMKSNGGKLRIIRSSNIYFPIMQNNVSSNDIKLHSIKNNIINILSKDNSTKYGNEDINKFISKINSLLDIKLPEDGKARMTVSNMLKLLSRHEKRLWLKENKWDNAKDWFDQYHQTNLSKGFYPRSWYKVYENLKLWIANEGDLSKLNKK